MSDAPGEPTLLWRHQPGWPRRLEDLAHPPAALHVQGAVLPREAAIAIVGSRRATLPGREIAFDLARHLARRGVQVVSGMARGIDAAAHRGALAGGGSTVAVLGCGLDVCYPPEHLGLRGEIVECGCLVSEYPAGTAPRRGRFPTRNRIIAALVLGVVVVEAAERSGALSTARNGVDLGREVFAVPGSIRSERSRGSNALIRDGAVPLLEPDDVLTHLPALRGLAPPDPGGWTAPAPPGLPPLLAGVLEHIGHDPVHPDALGMELGLEAAVVGARLTALEVAGRIRTVSGGLVLRTF
ncbi:MAG: DNA-processing protein DprA [Candidatus Dormibacteria bacterium]